MWRAVFLKYSLITSAPFDGKSSCLGISAKSSAHKPSEAGVSGFHQGRSLAVPFDLYSGESPHQVIAVAARTSAAFSLEDRQIVGLYLGGVLPSATSLASLPDQPLAPCPRDRGDLQQKVQNSKVKIGCLHASGVPETDGSNCSRKYCQRGLVKLAIALGARGACLAIP